MKRVVHVMPIEFDDLKDEPLPNRLVNMMYKNDKICKYLYSNTDCHIQGLYVYVYVLNCSNNV